MTNEKDAKQKPTAEFRMGRIKAAIWKNQVGEYGTRYSVTVARLYKKTPDAKTWNFSDSFGRDDLPLVYKVLGQAHTWIFEQAKNVAA